MRRREIKLPQHKHLEKNLFETLLARRSIRSFENNGISLYLLGDLLYYIAGVKGKKQDI